ncbi:MULTISPECIES: YodC family protein [Pseudomonas]|uniref:YodC family protein n=1 Tax=Pseudomonas TaxID=286 RepID=UPI0007099BA9|nr:MULTISPECIES: DUF2158 domain-containing protein [Pseudomonas]WIN05608.1 DUF2158 domain-containing protein [Pseudomonas syringae pv. antirrhini str. 126]
MSKQEFVVGSIVKLRSGGPDMTVQSWDARVDYYACQWFAGKKLESGRFRGASLEPKTPEET